MPRKPSGRLSQHDSIWKIAGKTESSSQIVVHIFRANIKRSFRNQFITGLTTATQGKHEYNSDPKYC